MIVNASVWNVVLTMWFKHKKQWYHLISRIFKHIIIMWNRKKYDIRFNTRFFHCNSYQCYAHCCIKAANTYSYSDRQANTRLITTQNICVIHYVFDVLFILCIQHIHIPHCFSFSKYIFATLRLQGNIVPLSLWRCIHANMG